MNLDLLINQKLDFITKGLSAEIKAAYNTDYYFQKTVEDTWKRTSLFISLHWKIPVWPITILLSTKTSSIK